MDYLVNGKGWLINLAKPLNAEGALHLQGAPCNGEKGSAEVALIPSGIDIQRVLDLWNSRIELHDHVQRQRDVMTEEEAIEHRNADPLAARYKFLVTYADARLVCLRRSGMTW